MSSQPRFMLLRGTPYKDPTWIIISSSDRVRRERWAKSLDHEINHGTVRPNNFGNSYPKFASGHPEQVVGWCRGKVEHHGYFRTLEELRDYAKMMEIVDV